MKKIGLLILILFLVLTQGCKPKPVINEKLAGDKPKIDSSLIRPLKIIPKNCGEIILTEEQQREIKALYSGINQEIERDMMERDINNIPEMIGYDLFIHVVSENGRCNIQKQTMLDAVKNMNKVFNKAYINFQLKNIDSIRSSSKLEDMYYGLYYTDSEAFFDKYNKEKAINLYLMDNNNTESYLNGFTFPVDLTLPTGRNRDLICIATRTIDNGKTLIHEMGHFFTLLHTFNVLGCGGGCRTEELADGSNCSTTGDLICDTPADPADVNYVDVRLCRFVGEVKDDKGNLYKPQINNFMSYYEACCDYQFTTGQYAIVRKIADKFRLYLKAKNITPPPIISTPTAPTTNTTAKPVTTTKPVTITKPAAATTKPATTTTTKPAATTTKPATTATTKPTTTTTKPATTTAKPTTTKPATTAPTKPTTTTKATTTKPTTGTTKPATTTKPLVKNPVSTELPNRK